MPAAGRRYLAFDIETATDVAGADLDWLDQRPLGIACAAALAVDADAPQWWHGRTADGSPAKRMSREEAHALVRELTRMVADGYALVTWNGLGFDFDVLAEESGAWDECRELARNHIDLMFHVFCAKGFPVALDKAAQALGIPGKTPGMSGALAPQLWAAGRYQQVLDYVAQDVRITLQIAQQCEKQRRFRWVTRKGTLSSLDLPHGWLSVERAMLLPEPDTSWMTDRIPRQRFTKWLGPSPRSSA